MNNNFIVVNNPKDWAFDILGVEVIEAREYCISNEKFLNKRIRVFNLCRSYRYQSIGYYVSLIASARGHRVFPDINTIQEIKAPQLVRILAEDLDNLIQRSLKNVTAKTFELSVYFGKNISKRYDKLSREIYNLFQAPMLRAYFSKKNNIWKIQNIDVISGSQIPDEHYPYVVDFATQYFSSGIVHKKRKAPPPYDMAILVNDKDETPPSDKKAIEQFIKSAANNGFDAQIINKDSPQHIGEFDALFIRETTSVNHHTFRLAQKAAAQGIVVIDDPDSIIKCTNKVYLAELLKHNKIPLPESAVLIKDSLRHFPENRKFPIILKQPDSSYSHGIVKAENKEDFTVKAHQLFEKSDLLIAQEYIRTDFDWRVGVLDGKPLYVCKYYMAKDHWQIINWTKKGKWHLGGHECLPVENVPKAIIRTALRACNCIGKGLYGVDLKQVKDKCYVIEVNDNPSIESDVEDVVYGSLIYNTIMKVFYDRVCRLKGR